MKNLILLILITSLSTISVAAAKFQISIPQPDRITNGDFDGDGILDQDDSSPFGGDGQSSTPPDTSSSVTFTYTSGENGQYSGYGVSYLGNASALSGSRFFTHNEVEYEFRNLMTDANYFYFWIFQDGTYAPESFYDDMTIIVNGTSLSLNDILDAGGQQYIPKSNPNANTTIMDAIEIIGSDITIEIVFP